MNYAIGKRSMRVWLAVVLLLGLIVRLPTIALGFHVSIDVDVYLHWADIVETRGLTNAYESPELAAPPLQIYLFAGATWLEQRLTGKGASTPTNGRVAILLIQLSTLLSDVLAAGLLAWIFWRRSSTIAVLVAALYLFNPAVWYVTAIWGQTDSNYTLLLIGSVAALSKRKVSLAWLLFAFAFAVKVQSIALAPLIFIWSLAKFPLNAFARGLAVGILAWSLISAPWLLSGHGGDLVRMYITPPETRAVTSAYNLWYLVLGGNLLVSSEIRPVGLPLSYQDIGDLLFASCALVIVGLALKYRVSLAIPAAALCVAMFLMLTQMHERHAFPALAFLAWCSGESMLAAENLSSQGDLRRHLSMWWLYSILTATILFNLLTILPPERIRVISILSAPPGSLHSMLLLSLSFLAAIINLLILAWLIKELATQNRNNRNPPKPDLAA